MPEDVPPIGTQPEDLENTQTNVEDFANAPSLSTGDLAAAFGGGAGAAGVPSMIGDFFGNNYEYAFLLQGPSEGPNEQPTSVAAGGGDRRFKFSDNNSPFPRNRIFYNFHHFHNAVLDIRGIDRSVNRSTFGLEKTLINGWGSVEIRVPFAGTVSSNPTFSDPDSYTGVEFGNIALAMKALIVRSQNFAASVGLGMVLPTGEDFIIDDSFTNVFRNESVHFQPFLGVYHAVGRRGFVQYFTQFDLAANGSDVTLGSETSSLTTQSLLMLDLSMGYWLHRDRGGRYLRGVAPMLELHYTTTVEDQDYGSFRQTDLFVIDDRRDVLNITGGVFLQLGDLAGLKIGTVAPLRTGTDKIFDAEIGVQFTRAY